jgi:hypothetical protein
MVVDQSDPKVFQKSVRKLKNCVALREQLGGNAKLLAAKRHDAVVVSGEICSILRVAARYGKD